MSCSPYRVPVARLAAAQAALAVQGRRLIAIFAHRRRARPSQVRRVDPRLARARQRRLRLGRSRSNPSPEEGRQLLSDVFHFHQLSVEDALSELQYPKVESYDDYLYLILHGIDFQRREHCFKTHDVDFFLGAQLPGHGPRRATRARSSTICATSVSATR